MSTTIQRTTWTDAVDYELGVKKYAKDNYSLEYRLEYDPAEGHDDKTHAMLIAKHMQAQIEADIMRTVMIPKVVFFEPEPEPTRRKRFKIIRA